MIKLILFFLFLISGFRVLAGESIVLAVGQTQSFPTLPSTLIFVEKPKIIHVTDLGRSIRVTTRKSGTSLLRLGTKVLTVHVLKEKQFSHYQYLQNILIDKLGLELSVQNEMPTITGELLRLSDWPIIDSALAGEFRFQARIHSSITEQAKQFLIDKMLAANLPELPIALSPYPVVFIQKKNNNRIERYKQIFSPLGIPVELDTLAVEIEPLVEVQITVAEIKRSWQQNLGVKVPAQVDGVYSISQNNFLINDPQFSIQALEKNGLAKILATPTLLCRSGKTAEFLAGGEFPIRTISIHTHDIVWKRYGVLLKVSPVANTDKSVSIAIETEVSTIDDSQKVDGVPGMLTNRIQTHFDLKRPRTIALSGLIKQEWSKSKDGIPLLQRLPIIGRLVSSQEFRENKSELVFFVTPKVLINEDSSIQMPQNMEAE